MQRINILGLLAVSIALVIASCNSEGEFPPAEDYDFFVQFTINGTETRFENGVNGYGNGPGRVSYADNVGPIHSEFTLYSTATDDISFGKNIVKIQRVEVKEDSIVPTYAESYQLFSVGNYNYGSAIEDSVTGGINGVVIEYVDGDSTVWTSDAKIGAQESSASFEITAHEDSSNELFGAKTAGTFNCRVFNQNGNHLDLANGTFRARTIFKEQ